MPEAVLAVWMAQALLATLLCAWTLRLLRRPQPRPDGAPPVLVVVPVRGPAPVLDAFLAGLAAQDWPGWRVAFAVEGRGDPAVPALRRFVAAHPGRARLVVAGPARLRGQKVHNLLAALRDLRPGDAAVVTLDADIVPPPDLLRELLRPVLAGQAALSSGYRWTLPAPGAGWPALALAQAEAAIGTVPRAAWLNLCWGGATAIGRAALARLDLPRLWDRALSDDMPLTRAARAAGLTIYAPLTVRPPTPVAHGLAGVLRFGRRQYQMLRLHAPRSWAAAGALLVVPALGGATALALAARGDARGLACLGAAALLLGLRQRLRAALARRVLPADAARAAEAALGRGAWLQPVALPLHLAAWAASAFGREVAWAGRRYRVDARGGVTALARTPGPAGRG